MCLLVREEVYVCNCFPKRRTHNQYDASFGNHPSSPGIGASIPCWMGEVAAFAQVLTHVGLLKTIQNHVQFARARFGTYDTIDFVVVLLGYALSGERTLDAYYARLAPFADVFMALFERDRLPDRS